MSPGLNADVVTMAAVNLKGDQAFQSLYSGIGLTSLLASAVVVGIWAGFKKPGWGIGTGVIVVFAMYFIVSGFIAPIITSFSSGSGQISLTGTGKFRSLLNLSGIGQGQLLGTFIVCIILVVLLAKRFKWGKGVSIIMIVILPIFYLHWWLPFWASTGFSLGSIPGLG